MWLVNTCFARDKTMQFTTHKCIFDVITDL